MSHSRHPFLLLALLLAIGLRTVLGAPCCVEMAQATEVAAEDHSNHDDHGDHKGGGHSGHGEDPSSNPCCSACGPTLPPELVQFNLVSAPRTLPEPTPIRALATRPPHPAYNATGPPLLI